MSARFDPREPVSAVTLGQVLGLTERRIHQLEKQGVFEKSGRGKFPLSANVQRYLEHCRETEMASATERFDSRKAYEAEQARKLKLQNDRTERLLIPLEEAIETIDVLLGPLRTDLSGVPAQVTEDIEERLPIERAIRNVLTRLADRFEKASAALEEGRDPSEAVDG